MTLLTMGCVIGWQKTARPSPPCILDGFGFMGRISPTQRLQGRRNYMLRPQKHLALAHTPQQKGACVPWMMFWPSALHAVS